MYRVPDWFARRLEREFGGRLRLRWSITDDAFHLEQKVGRAALPPIFISEVDDDRIRARDGYAYVMSLRLGDRMPCPDCGLTLRVPVMRTMEVSCGHCRTKGRDGRTLVGCYPFSEILLEKLRAMDPLRDGVRRQARRVRTVNEAAAQARARQHTNDFTALFSDHLPQLMNSPVIGWTPATG